MNEFLLARASFIYHQVDTEAEGSGAREKQQIQYCSNSIWPHLKCKIIALALMLFLVKSIYVRPTVRLPLLSDSHKNAHTQILIRQMQLGGSSMPHRLSIGLICTLSLHLTPPHRPPPPLPFRLPLLLSALCLALIDTGFGCIW